MPETTPTLAASDETGEGTSSASTSRTDLDEAATFDAAPTERAARPIKSFVDCGVDPLLAEALASKGIHAPFPIQETTLPVATKGHDVIGQARTGTGKTLAFGLALLGRITPGAGTQALVIVPTRELCIQVAEELQIGKARGLRVIAVYGGVGYEEQEAAFREGHEVVVGTPGRLLDHVNKRNLVLDDVSELVLDEADEMLDMGFLPDVERLIQACSADRHGMLFSATMPTDVVKLARRYLDHPTFMRADHEAIQTAPNVEQHFFQVHRMDKPRVLARILQSRERGGVYVFVRTKHMADRLVRELEDLSTPAIAIHGDLRQSTREKNLDRFRDGSATVLVATEVAARGLDVDNVTHVVNYDCPDDEKMYLHRIGRTARAGAKGVAVTFAEFNEIDRLNVIRKKVSEVENPIASVFSTSDELSERFDLPAERPWDAHVAAAKAGTRTDRRAPDDDRVGRDGGRGGRDGGRGGRDGGRGGRDGGRGKGPRGGGRGDSRSAAKTPREDAPRRDRGGEQPVAPDRPTRAARSDRDTSERDVNEVPAEGRRRSSTEARPKSKRSSEGTGGDGRDADRSRRERSERPSAGATVSEESTSSDGRTSADGRNSSEGGSASEARTRTRTRTRTRATDDSSDRETSTSSTSSSSGRTRARAGSGRTTSTPSEDTSSGRTRARNRDGASGNGRSSRGTERPGRASSDGDGGTRNGRAEGGRSGGGRSGGERSSGGRSGGERSAGEGSSGGRSGGERSGGDRSATRSEGERSGGDRSRGGRSGGGDARRRDDGRGGRGDDRRGRGGRGGRGGQQQDRGGRGGERREVDPTVTVARRGEEARGEGDPQLARRVKVEHLP